MDEIWKPVEGFNGYEVSNLGNVKGARGTLLSPSCGTTGYAHVTLFKNGKRHYKMVHRLVAQAFVPNKNNLPVVNHKDEDKTNNTAINLEWCTQAYNLEYGTRKARMVKSKQKPLIATLEDGSEEYYISVKDVYKILKTHITAEVVKNNRTRKSRKWRYATIN